MPSDGHHKTAMELFVPQHNKWFGFHYNYTAHPDFTDCVEDRCLNDVAIMTIEHDLNSKFFIPICLPKPGVMPSKFQMISNVENIEKPKFYEKLEGVGVKIFQYFLNIIKSFHQFFL